MRIIILSSSVVKATKLEVSRYKQVIHSQVGFDIQSRTSRLVTATYKITINIVHLFKILFLKLLDVVKRHFARFSAHNQQGLGMTGTWMTKKTGQITLRLDICNLVKT